MQRKTKITNAPVRQWRVKTYGGAILRINARDHASARERAKLLTKQAIFSIVLID